ncbi:nonstructural protein [Microviridae sp.]|nr:nonstructural protein [Microviridae sp.]
MKIVVYSIRDSASGAFQKPFFARSDGEAMRAFGDVANDETHAVGQHPEHYTLFRLGQFDDSNAEILPETKESLANGLELVSQNKVTPITKEA